MDFLFFIPGMLPSACATLGTDDSGYQVSLIANAFGKSRTEVKKTRRVLLFILDKIARVTIHSLALAGVLPYVRQYY